MCNSANPYHYETEQSGTAAGSPILGPIPSPQPNPLPGQIPTPIPIPWPNDWWRCLRFTGISGAYTCLAGGIALPQTGLDLRIDVDSRYANSPVMNRVSGDFYTTTYSLSGFPPRIRPVRVYGFSWIIDSPLVTWSRCRCVITGAVRYWKGTHLPTTATIEVDWSGSKTLVTATFVTTASTKVYNGERISDCFRSMNLEVDVCTSVNADPILPEYHTHWHPTRPAGLPGRTLTTQEAFREAGVCVTLRSDRTIIDDSAATFTTWSVGELHDAMETNFSQFPSGWPKWEMWGGLVGRFDSSSTAGIMFDAAAAYGGSGEAPDRQGFAVARNHSWFNDLVTGTPANNAQAEAMRQYLYTWVHEAGHAFNFLHSWNKGRPNSLSWMNYPQRVVNFWNDFELRFDDEELIHMRHGDRTSVIMGADDWASGGHLESPTLESLSPVIGDTPLEVLLRSKDYFDFLEPVKVEIRLRNTLEGVPIEVDTRLQPEHGRAAFLVQRPDGRILDHESVFCKVGEPDLLILKGANMGREGDDRYSESVTLSYGKHGFLFADPGEYRVRAFYHAPDGFVYSSNIIRLRVGRPFSRDEDKLAQDYFSKEVGLILALEESRSPHLKKGKDMLEEVVDRMKGTAASSQIATVLAAPLVRPFHRIVESKGKAAKVVKQVVKSDPEAAIAMTDAALAQYKKDKSRAGNLGYHDLVRMRANALKDAGKPAKAKAEVATLKSDLEQRGVNASVLKEVEDFEKSL